MAIPTVFDITFGCGHAGTVDAADRAADQRGPWIAYLSSKGMWEVVRCWPGLADGAIPVVTGE